MPTVCLFAFSNYLHRCWVDSQCFCVCSLHAQLVAPTLAATNAARRLARLTTPNFFLSFFFFLFLSLLRILRVDSFASRLSPLAPRRLSSLPFFAMFLFIDIMGGCRPPHPRSILRLAEPLSPLACPFVCLSPLAPRLFSSAPFFAVFLLIGVMGGYRPPPPPSILVSRARLSILLFSWWLLLFLSVLCISLLALWGAAAPHTPAQFSFRRSLVARALEFVRSPRAFVFSLLFLSSLCFSLLALWGAPPPTPPVRLLFPQQVGRVCARTAPLAQFG